MKDKMTNILYNKEYIKICIPESRLDGVLSPKSDMTEPDHVILNRALLHPFDSPKLDEFIRKDESLLIIVNDSARHTPTARILEMIRPTINKSDVQFLVATGAHRPPSITELELIFGSYYQTHRSQIFYHDCWRDTDLESVGTTDFGTHVLINRRVLKASKILIIGSVEPHYFAGFTGGRKALVPGVAGFQTIEQNHSHAMSALSEPMKLMGNPVHEDMVEAVRMLDKKIFSIQMVLNNDNRVDAAFTGDIHVSMNMAAERAREVYGIQVSHKADIVLAVTVPPLDSNLYQSQKAMEHARLILNTGGILILVSACSNGIGPDAFYRLLTLNKDFNTVMEIIQQGYKLGYHKAAKWIGLLRQASLFGVTQLDPEILGAIHMTSFTSLQKAIDHALEEKSGKVWVMPSASVTVPICQTIQ
ncbi:nickel-dependent lactate racemase [bacterium]|nr:nickel-dependent lactate racemase [bacterium]